MTIRQAKEDLIKMILSGRATVSTEKSLNIAIKSLDTWNKVLIDLENLSENITDEVGGSKFTVNFIIKMIKEYMEEIEK